MGKTSPVAANGASLTNLPLSVLLFNAAMTQNIALSDFAEQIGLGALSLRQFISGQTQRPRGKTLELLAEALGISLDEARHRTSLRPITTPSFADWLKAQMDERFSRAKLTRETRISDGALRNYLAGQTLPDADQAQRLADALGVSSLDIAQVIVADLTLRSGGETAPAPIEEPFTPLVDLSLDIAPDVSSAQMNSDSREDYDEKVASTLRLGPGVPVARDEDQLIHLWRQLHPQGRRATLIYIAGLLAEG
ncbi:MAG: helix-turn-helix transcriptional regulator [Chloroflexales bacterium]|nr:helix-turn-helix transcriptional regulator [Chloroflexales bacterium]